ncbi:MAG: glycosyl transferase [Phycisphaerae bacterium]|jgi:glycosyltransferase involved in cell wall biosynthesis|nr:MAG: glycosyl transferase [Phycisphaerae bacterium]
MAQAQLTVIYVLAKNEQANIERCLRAAVGVCDRVVVLDSGSTDQTLSICQQFKQVEVRTFSYRNHCESYNQIVSWHSSEEFVAILDADMQISAELAAEINQIVRSDSLIEAVIAPVEMYWDERPLKYCSLYPPKPIVFRGGRALFEPAGHGEHLKSDVQTIQTRARLVHDDRKPLEAVLANQWRYAKDTVRRSYVGQLTRKDRIRLRSPLMMLITPLYAFIVRRGFLDGKQGIIYALDRLIAEALTYRASLSEAVRRELHSVQASQPGPQTSNKT